MERLKLFIENVRMVYRTVFVLKVDIVPYAFVVLWIEALLYLKGDIQTMDDVIHWAGVMTVYMGVVFATLYGFVALYLLVNWALTSIYDRISRFRRKLRNAKWAREAEARRNAEFLHDNLFNRIEWQRHKKALEEINRRVERGETDIEIGHDGVSFGRMK
jgi:hypothetical protein